MFYSFHFQRNDLANTHPRYSSMHWNESSFIVKFFKETQVYDLTHWGRVTHICVSKLFMLGSDKSHYLKQCWIMIYWTLRIKLQWNFNRNSNIFIEENPFQNVVWKMTAWCCWWNKSIWLCTSNSVFLRVIVTNSPQLNNVHDLNGCHDNQKIYERCRTWSQLEARRSLLLSSKISSTSWSFIFSAQDGFEVVTWCVGWCLEKNKSPKVRFYKCKLIWPKIQSI